MSTLDTNFDFNSLSSDDLFAEDNRGNYEKDDRFYTLTKDKDGNGVALIRFLIDKEKKLTKLVRKINTTITNNDGKKRFVSEFSPATIGKPCPFQELSQKYLNAGDKTTALLYNTGKKYIANIKVLKDPANPENEGKNFLFEMSGTMHQKIESLVKPSQAELSTGGKPYALDNPMNGYSFRLVAKKGQNGQITYNDSNVVGTEPSSIYSSNEEAVNDIVNNTYVLSQFDKEDAYKSYEHLQDRLNWVQFKTGNSDSSAPVINSSEITSNNVGSFGNELNDAVQVQSMQTPVQSVQQTPVQSVQQVQQTQTTDKSLDDLLGDLM